MLQVLLEPLKHDVAGDVSKMAKIGPVDEAMDGRGVEAKVKSRCAGGRRAAHKFRGNAVSVKEPVNVLQRCLHRCRFSCASRAQEEDAQRCDDVKIVALVSWNESRMLQTNVDKQLFVIVPQAHFC